MIWLTGAWTLLNLAAVLWLHRRFAGRSYGFGAAPWPVAMVGGTTVLAGWGLASLPDPPVPAWTVVGVWVAGMPVPVWAAARRGRYPRWAPLERSRSAAALPFAVLALMLLAVNDPRAGVAMLPLLAIEIVPWLHTPPVPLFTVADHAQPWWPRTPGTYPDPWRPSDHSRTWDGSAWPDDPDRNRAARREIAQRWAGVLAAMLVGGALFAAGPSDDPLPLGDPVPRWVVEGGLWVCWGLLVSALAIGTVAAWRSLNKPLRSDGDFPPAGRPRAAAGPGWLVNPDDPGTMRFWDGHT